MSGSADDALLLCIAAACLVVAAHGVDVLSARRGAGGFGHSLAFALCGLALCLPVALVPFARSSSDVLLLLATAGAVVVSAAPLVRSGQPGEPDRRANPWDRAYRVHPSRVAQLLSPPRRSGRSAGPAAGWAPTTPQAPTAPPRGAVHTGIVLPSTPPKPPQPPRPPDVVEPAPRAPEEQAVEALQDVEDVVDGYTTLLGLRPPPADR